MRISAPIEGKALVLCQHVRCRADDLAVVDAIGQFVLTHRRQQQLAPSVRAFEPYLQVGKEVTEGLRCAHNQSLQRSTANDTQT